MRIGKLYADYAERKKHAEIGTEERKVIWHFSGIHFYQ